MRILLLTQVAPFPPDAGPKVKTYYLLRKLSESHDVDLVTFVRDGREREAARELQALCSSVTTVDLDRKKWREPFYAARGWSTGTPFLVARDRRAAMARIVRERLASGEVDVVHADQLSMAQYLPPSGKAKPGRLKTVFDAHNAVWKLVQSLAGDQPTVAHRAAAAVEWRLLRGFEGRVCREADLTLTVSTIDARELEKAAGRPFNVAVAPIGIETQDVEQTPVSQDHRRILSVATMHYPPNADALRWFRDRVWPLLSDAERSAGLDIVGSRTPRDLVQWSESSAHVQAPGYVPDLAPYYRQAGIFIVPLHAGSGMRVKILEAMARGLPVVSTSIGVEGLPVRDGEQLLVADDPELFSRLVAELLADPDRRRELGAAAREFSRRYDWRVCLEPVVDAYRQLEAAPELSALQGGARLQAQKS